VLSLMGVLLHGIQPRNETMWVHNQLEKVPGTTNDEW
jgi:hypothetical protein